MSSGFERHARSTSPWQAAGDWRPTGAQAEAFAEFKGKPGSLFLNLSVSRPVIQQAGDRDSGQDFVWVDGNGLELVCGAEDRHPVLVPEDDASGKPCVALGALGWRPNFTSANDPGYLKLRCDADPITGAERNDLPHYAPNEDRSLWWKVRMFPNGALANKWRWFNSGGTVIAGASLTPDNCPVGYYDIATGLPRIRNRAGVTGVADARHQRTGNWHTMAAVYKYATGVWRWSINNEPWNVAAPSIGVIGGDADALKLRIGGYASPPSPGIRQPATMCLASVYSVRSDIGLDTEFNAVMHAALAAD